MSQGATTDEAGGRGRGGQGQSNDSLGLYIFCRTCLLRACVCVRALVQLMLGREELRERESERTVSLGAL